MYSKKICDKQSDLFAPFTSSSVLIPTCHLIHFNQRCSEEGSRRAYLSFLVNCLLSHARQFEYKILNNRDAKWKTCYQDSGQSLLKRNFVPIPGDWELLRNTAHAFGVSICYLFVFLIELELAGFQPSVPPAEPIDWNSAPGRAQNRKKFVKISKLSRVYDNYQLKLTRKLYIH